MAGTSVRVNANLKAVALITQDDAGRGNLLHLQTGSQALSLLKNLIIDSRDAQRRVRAICVAGHLKRRQATLDRGREFIQAEHSSVGRCPFFRAGLRRNRGAGRSLTSL